MTPQVSVSQLRVASESMELFDKLLAGYILKPPAGEVPGTLFHTLAASFFADLAGGRLRPLCQEIVDGWGRSGAVASAIAGHLHDGYLNPLLEKKAAKLYTDQVFGLAAACDRFSEVLAKVLERFPRPSRAAHVEGWVLPPGKKHAATYVLHPGPDLVVAGQFDGALIDPVEGRLVVVEIKCKPEVDAVADLLQVSLYGWLLKESTGLRRAEGVVLYVETDGGMASYTSDELDAASTSPETAAFLARVRDRILESVGSKEKASATLSVPLPPGGGTDGALDDETRAYQERLLSILAEVKCRVRALAPVVGPRIMRFRLVPDLASTPVKKIIAQAQNLQVGLGLKIAPLIQAAEGYVSVDVPRRHTLAFTLNEALERGQATRPASTVCFPLGMAVDGRVVWADLSSSTMTSILVGGTAGSGKSEFLRSAAVALAVQAGPETVRLTLVDPKLVSFTDLGGLPHLAAPLITEREAAVEALGAMVEEMEARYQGFARHGVSHIGEYSARVAPLCHHVVLVDEYADLMVERTTRARLETVIQRLGQKGRAAGYHLVLATQRPDAKVVSPSIKANLQLKVALKVSTHKNSEVILDEVGAESLLGNGDMLVGGAVPIQRLQGPLATRTELAAALAPPVPRTHIRGG